MANNRWNADAQPRVLQTLPELDVTGEIEGALSAANLVLPPISAATRSDRHFDSNESFWDAILNQAARANSTVTLQNFFLSEWFPRSPGQFHTPDARRWRESAQDFVFPLTDVEKRIYEDSAPVDPIVYNLYGKYCMLRGGIGCIRLKPKLTEAGALWFMSASSTLSAHEGIPVAISESEYNNYIEYINEHGILPCTLSGKLKFLPEPLLSLYQDYTGVPHLYVLAEEVTPSQNPIQLHPPGPMVSVAVTFSSQICCRKPI